MQKLNSSEFGTLLYTCYPRSVNIVVPSKVVMVEYIIIASQVLKGIIMLKNLCVFEPAQCD